MSIQRAHVIGAGSGVGHATAGALTAAGAHVLASGRERDATDPAHVAALLAEADPDLVVVAAGAPTDGIDREHSWESFSEPWNIDVKIAFEIGRAALARPLRPGSTVVIVSSGAALSGSPRSGGYAGAKRTQMFLADYLQRAADARELGIRCPRSRCRPPRPSAGVAVGCPRATVPRGQPRRNGPRFSSRHTGHATVPRSGLGSSRTTAFCESARAVAVRGRDM